MQHKNKLMAVAVSAALAFTSGAHAISVTQNSNATDLANAILGGGVTILSASVTGADAAFGTFTDGNASGLDIDAGIMLSSGSVVDAVGPNTSDSITTAFGTAGSAALDAAAGVTTQDAAIFDIEFTTTGGDIFFNYLFASDEYNEFVDSTFNDAFALFLDGVNIALLDDGVTPVTINNVNGTTTPGLFNNNDPSDLGSPTPFDIEYDGFTNGFTASAFGLGAGTHTLSFQVADVGDAGFDSTVFIEAGSLTDDPDPMPMSEPSTLALLGLGMIGMAGLRRRYR